MGVYIVKGNDGSIIVGMNEGILIQDKDSKNAAITIGADIENLRVTGFYVVGTSKRCLKMINWILNFRWKFWR